MGAQTTLNELLISMGISVLMVLVTVWIHYEVLYRTSRALPKIHFMPGRTKIWIVILAAFAAHTIEVWFYALGFYLISDVWHIGALVDVNDGHKLLDHAEYLYYSAVTYTSLGFGDISPHGVMRFLSGVEALNGLVLIGWSASFTYIAMEKFWSFNSTTHDRRTTD